MSQDRALFDDRMLEPEFTAWNSLWIQDYGVAAKLYSLMCDNQGNVYFTNWNTNNSYVITRSGVITTLLIYWFLNYHAQTGVVLGSTISRATSATAKYVLGFKLGAPASIAVFRDGKNIVNLPYKTGLADANAIMGISISPNGRYIAAIFDSTTSFNARYVRLYQGV